MTQNNDQDLDFGALFEAHLSKLKTDFNIGDRLTGVVTALDKNNVFVDVGSRSDALIDRIELEDAEGVLSVAVGDQIEAYCVGHADDTLRLTTRMTGTVADASLSEAYEAGIPVEGRVLAERKGGYDVQIASHHAFCPYSQMDIHRREAETYVGGTFTFIISEYGENGQNLVLSRRRQLEQEHAKSRAQLEARLAPGDEVEGTVTRVMPFGAFVDLGCGVEGLVHVSELGWGRNLKTEDILAAGQAVTVRIVDLDWEKNRISLSLRHAQTDPWQTLGSDGIIVEGRTCEGVVTNLMPFGAFVELLPGIEGLIHISRLGAGRRINHPSEVIAAGDRVEVTILDIDHERRRIALAMGDSLGEMEEDDEDSGGEEGGLRPGATLKGTVDGHRDFGVFVQLPGGASGLLHVSQVELTGSSNSGRALYRMFPPGSQIDVVVRSIEGNRISLTLPQTLAKEAAQNEKTDFSESHGKGLGSLGDLFGGLDL